MDKELNNRRLMDDLTIPDNDDANEISATLYKEQQNDQKIEKLGNRVTIISMLLPCLLCAILLYGYLDIKKRVMLINNSGQTQVDVVAKEFESKLNSFEVGMAKIKLTLEKDIPELKQQTIAIQDELTLLAGSKSDKEATDKNLELIKEDIKKIADQYQGALHILDRTNQETLTIINDNGKELDAKIEAKMASVKAIEADLKTVQINIQSKFDSLKTVFDSLKTVEDDINKKLALLKTVQSEIDEKIDSKINSAIDKRIKTAVNEKLALHDETLNKKVADIELSVESKLATLQETTQILAEDKISISKTEKNIVQLQDTISNLQTTIPTLIDKQAISIIDKQVISIIDKQIASIIDKQITSIIDRQAFNIDNKYVDNKYVEDKILTLQKSLNAKIDELDLNLSKKILQYSTQLESSVKNKNSGSKKKNETNKQTGYARQENKTPIILTPPERGKISETDLTQ